MPRVRKTRPMHASPSPEPTAMFTIQDFVEAVDTHDPLRALEVVNGLAAPQIKALRRDRQLLQRILREFDMLDAVAIMDVFGRGSVDPITAWGALPRIPAPVEEEEPEEDQDEDPEERSEIIDDAELRTGEVNQVVFADYLEAQRVPILEQLELTGVLEGNPDWEVFFKVMDNFSNADRAIALMQVRAQDLWGDLLEQVDPSSVGVLQSWLDEDSPDDGGRHLNATLAAAPNGRRAVAALAAVDRLAARDRCTPRRITRRIRELLAVGTAVYRIADSPLARKGLLTPAQAERAALALMAMPDTAYVRALFLLLSVPDMVRAQQSVVLLKTLGAHLSELEDDGADGTMTDIESFADEIRTLEARRLARSTTVLQVEEEGSPGLQARFAAGCNVTSAVVIRAEADPLEAWRIHQEGQLPERQLSGHVAGETAEALDAVPGNTAVARDPSAVTGAVRRAVMTLRGQVPVADLLNVRDYLAGRTWDARSLEAVLPRIRQVLNQGGFPSEQELHLARARDPGHAPGLDPEQLAEAMNSSLGVYEITGSQAEVTTDEDLWEWFTGDCVQNKAVSRVIPHPMPVEQAQRITHLLNVAAARLEEGLDVAANVYWEGCGGRTLSVHDVVNNGAARAFLVHDPGSGSTAWIDEDQILQGNWPGFSRRGLLGAIIG